jgi:hypothetical protein
MPDPTADRLRRHWRNPRFLLAFAPCALAWLALTGWLVWLTFNPVTDWIGRQNAFVQEVLGTAAVCVVAVFAAAGVGGAAHLAEGAAGLRPRPAEVPPPAPLPPGAKKWARGRNALPAPPDA